MATKHTYVRILKDGITLNGQVCLAGDIMQDPPYAVIRCIQEDGGVLGQAGKVYEMVDAKEVAKIQAKEDDDTTVHAPGKTVHTDPEGLKVQPVVKKKFPKPEPKAKKKEPAKEPEKKKTAAKKKAAKKKSR